MQLIWLDLETTGLNPATSAILEVAAYVATLDRPFDLEHGYHGMLECNVPETVLDPIVVDMHKRSGLFAECRISRLTLAHVEAALLARVPEVTDREDMPTLAGSSVHFDLSFIRYHMPRVAKRLSHRVYDVSAVVMFCRSLGMPKPPRALAHRAEADIRESVALARHCEQWLAVRRTTSRLVEGALT